VYSSSKSKLNEKSEIKPISYYGTTKLLAERYIIKKFKNSKNIYCIGRIFSTTNNNQKMNYLVPDLKKRIKKTKKKIILKDLNHYRDFISMHNISNIIMALYKKKKLIT
jgi:nucleoside-diphosphate-sugar epimerase